jgi:RHS repeat-associated protein
VPDRRLSKTVGGTTTKFLYDGPNVVQEQNSGNTATANLLTGLGIDEAFSRQVVGGATSSLLTDALGSTIALGDANGAVQTSYTYEPFGAVTSSGATSTNSYQFTGRENDGSTGLYFYRARYYNPTFGRFISEDPLAFPGGPDPDLYSYVGTDPVSLGDPFGLDPGGGCGFLGFGCLSGLFSSIWSGAKASVRWIWWGARALINTPVTLLGVSYSELQGADCDWEAELTIACYGTGGPVPRGGFTLGNTFITWQSKNMVTEEMLGHERKHSDQWAIFTGVTGNPLSFPVAYGIDWVQAGGNPCRQGFEQWAGLKEGGYDCP